MHRRLLLTWAAMMPLLPRIGWAQEARRAAGARAMGLAAAQRWAEADSAASGADPLIAKVITWMRLQQKGQAANAPEIAGWVMANPDWPMQDTLGRRAEEALATDPDDALAAQYFAARAPKTLDGYQRLADALGRGGRSAEATATLRGGWVEAPADPVAELSYLTRNASALTPEEHWRRFNRLALERQTAAAGRVLPYLDPARGALANARLAYGNDQPDADGAAAITAGDPALTAERARWLRRRNLPVEAAAAFAAGDARTPNPPQDVARAAWAERQIVARTLLRQGDDKTAYAVVTKHGITAPGEQRQEAEFLAGFLALQRLNDSAGAEKHFSRINEESRSVITKARGLYWQGRAAAYQNQIARARQRYLEAAAYPLAFYGQLASISLGQDGEALSARIQAVPAPQPTAAQAAAFDQKELVRVVQALADIGESKRARPFLLRLEELTTDPAEDLLAIQLAHRIGRPDHAIWVVRRASASGLMARGDGWPTPFPPPTSGLEPALVFAITRQESNFDMEAVSPANARGLMQLLPATAAQVAKRLGLAHQTGMLTTDATHNMRLGAGYLEQLSERFRGTLPFMIAGYNAGPGRVDDWVGAFGDPRTGAIAMLDWMELIPFSETRNYVQRVIENMAVYRAADPRYASVEHPMTAWLKSAK